MAPGGLLQWLSGKEPTCQCGDAGDTGLIPGSGRSPGGEHGKPLWYSSLKKFHGQRSLVGYSPQGCKESDMTQRLTTPTERPRRHLTHTHMRTGHSQGSGYADAFTTLSTHSFVPRAHAVGSVNYSHHFKGEGRSSQGPGLGEAWALPS